MAGRPSIASHPILVPIDRDQLPIPFQFTADGLTKSVSAGYAEATSLTRNNPIIQFTRGSLKTIAFEARLYAEHELILLEPLVYLLEKSVQRDAKLGRPVVYAFVWGLFIAPSVVVSSVGGIKYNSMRTNGTARDITLSIELKQYEPFDIGQTDPNAKPHDTYYYHVKEGDTWEGIADTIYGDALLGEVLRRRYPGQHQPTPFAIAKLPDREKMDGISVQPSSIPLRRVAANNTLRTATYKLRNRPRRSAILSA